MSNIIFNEFLIKRFIEELTTRQAMLQRCRSYCNSNVTFAIVENVIWFLGTQQKEYTTNLQNNILHKLNHMNRIRPDITQNRIITMVNTIIEIDLVKIELIIALLEIIKENINTEIEDYPQHIQQIVTTLFEYNFPVPNISSIIDSVLSSLQLECCHSCNEDNKDGSNYVMYNSLLKRWEILSTSLNTFSVKDYETKLEDDQSNHIDTTTYVQRLQQELDENSYSPVLNSFISGF